MIVFMFFLSNVTFFIDFNNPFLYFMYSTKLIFFRVTFIKERNIVIQLQTVMTDW